MSEVPLYPLSRISRSSLGAQVWFHPARAKCPGMWLWCHLPFESSGKDSRLIFGPGGLAWSNKACQASNNQKGDVLLLLLYYYQA